MKMTGFNKNLLFPIFASRDSQIREPYRIGKNKEIPFFKSENLEKQNCHRKLLLKFI